MTREAEELVAELQPTSFWFRGRNELLAWALDRYFPQARTLLEVGCGTGYVLEGFRRRRPALALTGVEASADALEIARRRVPDARLLAGDARQLDLGEEFDVVACLDVLEHVDDDEAVLDRLYAAANRGGGLLVTVPQHPRLWSAVDEFSEHKRRYTRAELLRKVEAAGFRAERTTSFVSLLLPVVAGSRLLRRGDARTYDPRTEYRLPRSVDRVFAAVGAAERLLIRAGVSFPAGGSLLLVARRA